MKKDSVWRVAALPATAMVLCASMGVAALSSRSSAQRTIALAVQQGRALTDVDRMVQLDLAMQLSLIVQWNDAMGHPSDLAEPLDRVRSALDVARQSPVLAEGLSSVPASIETIARMPEGKARLGATRTVHAVVLASLLRAENELGPEAEPLHNGVGRLLDVDDQFTYITSRRAFAGVDPLPATADMRAYAKGLIAGDTTAHPPTTLRAFLLSGATGPAVRVDLAALATRPEMAAYAHELAWANGRTAGGAIAKDDPTFVHADFATLEASRKALVFGIRALLSREVERMAAKFDVQRRLAAETCNARTLWMLGSLFVSALLFGWLLLRLRRSMGRLHRLAETDSLTGSMNRIGLRHHVEPWMTDRGGSPVALAVVDLDRFKSVNDTYGHGAGDDVLREVSSRLRSSTIADSTAVGRWGGDEYVMAFRFPNGIAEGDVDRVMARVQLRLREPLEVAGELLDVSATIGVVTCTCGACDFDDLFRSADHALYVGKFEGRDRIVSVRCDFEIGDRFGGEWAGQATESPKGLAADARTA